MNAKQAKIVKEWKKEVITHQSLGAIAKKVGVSKTYVFDIINKFKEGKLK